MSFIQGRYVLFRALGSLLFGGAELFVQFV